jgi:hypothetical protein
MDLKVSPAMMAAKAFKVIQESRVTLVALVERAIPESKVR